jgi:glycosyltransferase involved in cell wall biosynthesis
MSNLKKVLIIAYLFPPIGGGGVQRALKMAKYLREFGWEPHVLTVAPSYHATLDESLLAGLPEGIHIHRTKEVSLGNPAAPGKPSISASTAVPPSGLKTKIKRMVFPTLKKIKKYLLVPDDQILWIPFAVKKGLEVVKEYEIDAIFSTSGPYTNHLVGLYLKRKTEIPWIADFRDPWTQNMHRTDIAWREWLEERLERMVLRESDGVLTVTQSFADNFREKFGDEIKQIEVIHNGFDPADYLDLEGIHGDADICTFIYTGIFYRERNPRLFLRAIKELIDERKLDSGKLRLQFAGVFDYPGYTENMDCVKQLGLEEIVQVMGNLPHHEALASLKRADILLLVGDTAPGSGDYIPGKLFEYMAVGRPILALSLPGESTRIIEKYQLGQVVDPKALDQIKQAILRLYDQWKAPRGHNQQVDKPSTLLYQRKEQARLLAEYLNKIDKRG